MKELEKIMRENRAEFQDQEPSMGHIERFESRLSRTKKRTQVIHLTKQLSQYAAVMLLVIMSGLWGFDQWQEQHPIATSLSQISSDYQEVEYYFTSQIEQKTQQLTNTDLIDNKQYQQEMLMELEQMDSVYDQLQLKLGENPDDERIIQAMVMHYQTKLKVINDILQRINDYQKNNNSDSNNQKQDESVEL